MEPSERLPLPYLAELRDCLDGLDETSDPGHCWVCSNDISAAHFIYCLISHSQNGYWERAGCCEPCTWFVANFGAWTRQKADKGLVFAALRVDTMAQKIGKLRTKIGKPRTKMERGAIKLHKVPKWSMTGYNSVLADRCSYEDKLAYMVSVQRENERALEEVRRETLTVMKLYPTAQEYLAKVHHSARVYLLVIAMGLPHDVAWPIVALTCWILA